jgi:hypothetical protein
VVFWPSCFATGVQRRVDDPASGHDQYVMVDSDIGFISSIYTISLKTLP